MRNASSPFVYILLAATAAVPVAAAQETPAPPVQATPLNDSDKPRVFITDSRSWEVGGSAGGADGVFAGSSGGGARPQTAEIVKTFGEKCRYVVTNNIQAKANYIVVLDHEGGKGWLAHKNKVAVFDARSGDSVVSKSTLSLGGSVEEACRGISNHWPTHRPAPGSDPAPSSQAQPGPSAPAVASRVARLSISSTPEGADIEVDGNFVGNTPSAIEVAPGDHTVSVKKSGYKTWERKLKATGGGVNLRAELEKEGGN
ncbi:MAG TPA: PEGA domain-containing protein [Verrucomicrobiae bacterium]|jgi:hypothetical protein|nr:PEGA domain-containing protein [Verrucomicrobiae bacterium]